MVEAQVRALVNVATPFAPPEARARLLGGALEGGAGFESAEETLIGMLRRRFHALHGEIRLLPGALRVGVGGRRWPALRRPSATKCRSAGRWS